MPGTYRYAGSFPAVRGSNVHGRTRPALDRATADRPLDSDLAAADRVVAVLSGVAPALAAGR